MQGVILLGRTIEKLRFLEEEKTHDWAIASLIALLSSTSGTKYPQTPCGVASLREHLRFLELTGMFIAHSGHFTIAG
jgi:hypothetical protein